MVLNDAKVCYVFNGVKKEYFISWLRGGFFVGSTFKDTDQNEKGGVIAFAQADGDTQKHPSFKYCGIDREKFAHSRMLIEIKVF
jgi:hypothetical protein